jgi:uncharacterized membrane protein
MVRKLNHSTRDGMDRVAADRHGARTARRVEVDIVRGAAVLLMVGFHLVFDLAHFGFVQQDFYTDPFWLGMRTLIVTMFLGVSGVSLHLAAGRRVNLGPAGRRFLLLAGAAGLVSVATFMIFPVSWVRFGVLHFLALAGLLGLLFARLPWAVNLALGLGVILAGLLLSHPLFDNPWLHWIGFMTNKPRTEDYVPLIPWFGVVLVGLAFGRLLYSARPEPEPDSAPFRLGFLSYAGRQSLIIYLLHQPLLFGLIWLIAEHFA